MFATLLAAHLLVTPALAGSPCGGVKFEQDKFTHQETAWMAGSVWAVGWILGWEATWTEGKAAIKFSFPVGGVHDAILPAGWVVKLLQEDGTVVELATTEETRPTPGASSGAVYTTWLTTFQLSKETLQQLASQKITAVRAPLPPGDTTWETNGGSRKRLSKAFGCFATK